MRAWGSVAGGRPAGSSSERPGTVACASEGQQAASCRSLGRAGATIRLAKTERRPWCRGWAEPRRAVCPRPVAASAAPGLLPCDRPPPVLAEEFVEGLSEQGLDRPALSGAEHAQLAVDGWGKVAGDLDAAGTAVPGGPAGSGDSASLRARAPAKGIGISVSGIPISQGVAQARSQSAYFVGGIPCPGARGHRAEHDGVRHPGERAGTGRGIHGRDDERLRTEREHGRGRGRCHVSTLPRLLRPPVGAQLAAADFVASQQRGSVAGTAPLARRPHPG